MTAIFADTSFYVAVTNSTDALHEAAKTAAALRDRVVTTEFVLVEVANFLAEPGRRSVYARLVRNLQIAPEVDIVPATSELFERGMRMFDARADKKWSLTDCISFCVMTDLGITDALTADHHFEQAGFRTLLK